MEPTLSNNYVQSTCLQSLFDHTEFKLNINYPESRKKLRDAFIKKKYKKDDIVQNGERGLGQIRNTQGARRNAHIIISNSIIKGTTHKGRTEKKTARWGEGHRKTQEEKEGTEKHKGGEGGTETHRGTGTHRGAEVGGHRNARGWGDTQV